MEIRYEYARKRCEFGRPCDFSDFLAEVTADIPPDPSLADDFIPQDPVDFAVQEGPVMALHEVNTDRVQVSIQGVNHLEGGWPKHVDPKNSELTTRYREEVEREEVYTKTIQRLGSLMEHYIRQNNTIDIYEEYFEEEEEEEEEEEPPSYKTINVLRDPNQPKRMATRLSWHPDGNKSVAVAYCSMEFQDNIRKGMCIDSYIWDLEKPYSPEMTLKPSSPVVTLEYNSKDWHHVLGGCYNGQIVYWDTRKGVLPVEMTPVEFSHRDPVYGASWLPSRTGTECFSGSTDGQVLWWDIRKLSQPSEKLILDITRQEQLKNALGAISLDFAPTLPTKFLVGTEQGIIISCNRDAKTPPEKIAYVFRSHIGAVYRVTRNPFFPKVFLSVGDWTARIWTEELMDSSSIMETKYHTPYLLDTCWSPIKPAVFFTSKSDGTVDIWDFLYHQKEPALTIKVSIEPLLSLCSQDNGRILGCSTRMGTVFMLEISSGFCTLRKNEKTLSSSMFEREARREKVLQDKHRERLVREQERARAQPEQQEDPHEVFKQSKADFIAHIKAEKRRRGMEDPGEGEEGEEGEAAAEQEKQEEE
ncbi:dynein axonemal intermediate chain 2 [Oenanthe melanoleuca]|uniref:dynein axonemal intermediate chain 2 n=1 Tax=Oenanthe melanoleuca TaxID=2939378 RepID=UPI0024C1498D|nr:dynein axonemal intermediate chain 2 [Oenanthe melanoleuca]XP_056361523.1 dynein axonemal intermediate chain 2 [Oenanthe melanoleuca]